MTGAVFDKQSRAPISGAEIRVILDDERGRFRRGMTDQQGRYRIEVPLGAFRLWFSRLPAGHWLDPADNTVSLATTPDTPVATHDFAANQGTAWPVRIVVRGGIPENDEIVAWVAEVEDDKKCQAWLDGKYVSFSKPLDQSFSNLAADGTGAFTQCGNSGKMTVSVTIKDVAGVMAEMLVEPGFENAKVKSIARDEAGDKTVLTDESGLTATIGKAEVTLEDGLPLVTFHLDRVAPCLRGNSPEESSTLPENRSRESGSERC